MPEILLHKILHPPIFLNVFYSQILFGSSMRKGCTAPLYPPSATATTQAVKLLRGLSQKASTTPTGNRDFELT